MFITKYQTLKSFSFTLSLSPFLSFSSSEYNTKPILLIPIRFYDGNRNLFMTFFYVFFFQYISHVNLSHGKWVDVDETHRHRMTWTAHNHISFTPHTSVQLRDADNMHENIFPSNVLMALLFSTFDFCFRTPFIGFYYSTILLFYCFYLMVVVGSFLSLLALVECLSHLMKIQMLWIYSPHHLRFCFDFIN